MASSGTSGGERWRELALEHVSSCRELILSVGSPCYLWVGFLELLIDVGADGARRADVKEIFDYAWWCYAESRDEDLRAAVEAHFYEDLAFFDNLKIFVPLCIAPWQFERLEDPFGYLYDDADFEVFRSWYCEAVAAAEHGARAAQDRRDGGPEPDEAHP